MQDYLYHYINNMFNEVAMDRQRALLLVIDGGINVLLGILLLLSHLGIDRLLGVPQTAPHFYATLLGAVLLGIGIALFLERFGEPHGIRGLGLEGAIAINLCGALTLMVWMLVDPFDLPRRGTILLWIIAVVVLAVGFVELLIPIRKQDRA